MVSNHQCFARDQSAQILLNYSLRNFYSNLEEGEFRHARQRKHQRRNNWNNRNHRNAGTGTGTALSQTAQDYGHKISEAANHAKDYVSDKVSVVGDKLKDLQNADLGELAENAKSMHDKNQDRRF